MRATWFSATYCGEPLFLPQVVNSLPFHYKWTHSGRQLSYILFRVGTNHTYIYTYKDIDIYIYGSKRRHKSVDGKDFLSLIKLYFSYTPWYDYVLAQYHKGLRGVHSSVHLCLNGGRSLTQIGKLCVTSHKQGEHDDRKAETMHKLRGNQTR
jgi:hypothetical protein